MFDVPILFLIYNRPDLTELVFAKIREIQPKSLFIAADGPKNDLDALECENTRKIIEKVDWPCDVRTLFRDSNMGCKLAVSSAISWFFENNEQGIILEDDTLPNDSFFAFCEELLNRYRKNEEVMSITGVSWVKSSLVHPYSYYFSNYPGIWGWATWSNRWKKFDLKMKSFPEFMRDPKALDFCSSESAKQIIANYLRNTFEDRIDSWGYIWHFCHFVEKRFCIVPKSNLVTNIGFDSRSTHTTNSKSIRAHAPTFEIRKDLNHPKEVTRNAIADRFVVDKMLLGKKPILERMISITTRWLKKLF